MRPNFTLSEELRCAKGFEDDMKIFAVIAIPAVVALIASLASPSLGTLIAGPGTLVGLWMVAR